MKGVSLHYLTKEVSVFFFNLVLPKLSHIYKDTGLLANP